jgi:ornithine cyclodeaminase/alanine dehydrogenase-like protein (mu-crystallin family)
MDKVMEIVEGVYRDHGIGSIIMPPKSFLPISALDENISTSACIMSGYLRSYSMTGIKWIGENFKNFKRYKIPNIISTILLNDTKNFSPKAIIQSNWITAARTGAATAIGIKYLARKDASGITIIGAGYQARFQLEAIMRVKASSEVYIYDTDRVARNIFIDQMRKRFPEARIRAIDSAEEGVKRSDIVVTVTSVLDASLVEYPWLRPGTLICSIGAGRECSFEVTKKANKIVVDNLIQCLHGSELGKWVDYGWLSEKDVYGEIGEIVSGKKQGREREDEIILFIPHGMVTLDIAVATVVLELAEKKDIGRVLPYF